MNIRNEFYNYGKFQEMMLDTSLILLLPPLPLPILMTAWAHQTRSLSSPVGVHVRALGQPRSRMGSFSSQQKSPLRSGFTPVRTIDVCTIVHDARFKCLKE